MSTKKIDNLIVNEIDGVGGSFKLAQIPITQGRIDGREIAADGALVDAALDGANCGKMAKSTYDFSMNAFSIGFDDWNVRENDYIEIDGHGLIDGDIMRMITTTTLPSPFATNTDYYVVNSDAKFFQLSATRNGTPISFGIASGSGAGEPSGSGSGDTPHTMLINQFGDISLRVEIPINSIIMNGFVDCFEDFLSASGEGDFMIYIENDSDLKSATNFNYMKTTPADPLVPDNTTTNMVKLTDTRTVLLDVGDEQITGGALTVFLEYVISN